MNIRQILGITLLVGGTLALVYGGFSYTKETHKTELGALNLSVENRDYVAIPVWFGAGAILLGGVLLLLRPNK